MKRVVLLEKCPEGKISKENMFLDLVHDIEIRVGSNTLLFVKNDMILFQKMKKNDEFLITYSIFWNIFEKVFGINSYKIGTFEMFCTKMLKKYLKF